tara:strand:- start:96282 stop:97142 length:861 start_codon:yes stop_codon:yes gene_type:complete
MKYIILFALCFSIFSCEIEGVKTEDEVPTEDSLSVVDSTKQEKESAETVVEEKKDSVQLDSGVKITWYQRGEGPKLSDGEVIKIDYRNKLEDGTVYDGNHLVKKPYLPFVVGWSQQTPGWDIAMEHLRVGDDVDIFIPSKLARGEKGIKGLVPPNANNILSLRVLGHMEPMKVVDGIKIWKVDERKNPGDSIDFKDEVYLDYWASTKSNPRYDNSYQRKTPFHLVMGDGNIVPGLYKALHFAREGDKLLIMIPAREAYGSKGLKDLVKPNEDLLYDIRVGRVVKQE